MKNELEQRIALQQQIVADVLFEMEQAEHQQFNDEQMADFRRRYTWEGGRLSGLQEAYAMQQRIRIHNT